MTLPALAAKVNKPDLIKETAPGEWQLGTNIEIGQGASLKIAAPTVRWLKLRSDDAGAFSSIKALGGGIDISGTCVTSWNEAKGTVDEDYLNGRGYLLARDGAQMTIDKAELLYLGFGDVESYGLSWRTEGSGGHITNSLIANLYFGVYSFDVGGLTISDNEVRDNVLYGIDPHTGSHNLTIERNVVHDNGKHGIILAEDCVDSVIRDNVVYRNQHHGIVLYLHSDRNLIEGNEAFNNAAQGVNINESVEQHDQGEPGLRQHRVRHRHRPDRQGQPRRGERRPRQQAGRAAPGQRGQPDRCAGQRHRRERALRRVRRQRRPVRDGRQHDLGEPHGRDAQGQHDRPVEREQHLQQHRDGRQERLTPLPSERPATLGLPAVPISAEKNHKRGTDASGSGQ